MTCKQHSVAASAVVPTEEKRTRPFSTIACGFENVQRAAVENCSHVFSVPTALRVNDKNYQKLYQSLLLRCSPCPGAAYATMRYLHTCKYSEDSCRVRWDSFCSIVAVSCPRSENWLKPAAASSVSTWHSAMFVEFLWIAGQIPMSQGLISPDYHVPPACALCSGRCRPSLEPHSDLLRYWLQHITTSPS